MSINNKQFRKYVIRPALNAIGAYSRAAEELLILTAAVESHGAEYIHQLGNGPALGPFQMEPATHDDIHTNYLYYKARLKEAVSSLCGDDRLMPSSMHLTTNLLYAAAMTRCHYLRVPSALPMSDDALGLARYWKEHYNTYLGAGTVEEAADAYRRWQ